MAKVLVIGSGGREHALAYKFSQSSHVDRVFVAPGNPGMRDCAEIVNIKADDFDKLIAFAKEKQIDLTFVGPEIPLCAGIADAFKEAGLRIFAPSKAASRLEGSKAFAKDMMKKYGIPGADYKTFDSFEKAKEYVLSKPCPIVLKADGLAAGKGVFIAQSHKEAVQSLHRMMVEGQFEGAARQVVIEEFLKGEEFSLLAFVNGELVVPMDLAQDHKRAFDHDEGLNTGGMGSYSPVNHLPQSAAKQALEKIMKPMAAAMVKEGCPFTGVLYGGCMLTEDGVKTIEFNVRFGDPETEVLLLRMENDLYEVIDRVMKRENVELKWNKKAACGVVMASKGYPESYKKGAEISGIEEADAYVFHMGTALQDGKPIVNGGRVLFVACMEEDLKKAQEKVYHEIKKIHCADLYYRTDIADKGVKL